MGGCGKSGAGIFDVLGLCVGVIWPELMSREACHTRTVERWGCGGVGAKKGARTSGLEVSPLLLFDVFAQRYFSRFVRRPGDAEGEDARLGDCEEGSKFLAVEPFFPSD